MRSSTFRNPLTKKDWERYREAFVPDGTLRDIYAKGASLVDWERFYRFLIDKHLPLTYSRSDCGIAPLPQQAAEVFKDQCCVHTLTLTLKGITLNCHFFTPNEIELDLDPATINAPDRLKTILHFMREVGQLLKKEIILTPENADTIIFRYSPDCDALSYIPD